MTPSYDLIVIGGGSAGHAAARTASGLGLRTALVESAGALGGLCILRGCMPSKTLIETANRMREIRHSGDFGIQASPPVLHLDSLRERVRRLTAEFRDYRIREMQTGGYELIRGHARFLSPHLVEITGRDGAVQKLGSTAFVIATGSKPSIPGIDGLADTPFWTSDDVVRLPRLPRHIAILGSGSIGLECAHLFEGLGSRVTVIVRGDRILSGFDPDISTAIERESARRDIHFLKQTSVSRVLHRNDRFTLFLGGDDTLDCDALLVATGRDPGTADLGLREIGLDMEKGRILADQHTSTSLNHIFAAGDCSSEIPVVHLAVIQGEIAARNAARLVSGSLSTPAASWNRDTAMTGLFTEPQAVQIGFTEDAAAKHGIRVLTAREDYNDQGKGIISGSRHGFVKVLADAGSGRIVGASGAGPQVLETGHLLQVAMELGLTARQYQTIPHYHPTLAEAWSSAIASLAEAP